MQIIYKRGNMFSGPEQITVHGCNAQGRMGSGVAKTVRDDFPEAYEAYLLEHAKNGLPLGSVVWALSGNRLIGNAITQEFYGQDGKRYVDYEAIRAVFRDVNALLSYAKEEEKIPVSMPLIGAGLAGGDWPTIAGIIEKEAINFQPIVYTLDGRIPGLPDAVLT